MFWLSFDDASHDAITRETVLRAVKGDIDVGDTDVSFPTILQQDNFSPASSISTLRLSYEAVGKKLGLAFISVDADGMEEDFYYTVADRYARCSRIILCEGIRCYTFLSVALFLAVLFSFSKQYFFFFPFRRWRSGTIHFLIRFLLELSRERLQLSCPSELAAVAANYSAIRMGLRKEPQ